MKRIFNLIILAILCLTLFGCSANDNDINIVATTLPVYDITRQICDGTDLKIARLISEDVACLHDYTLTTRQMQALEQADVLIISGADLESFIEDINLGELKTINASENISLLCGAHDHDPADHHHDIDPHYWLSPENAKNMASTIANNLIALYPEYSNIFSENLDSVNGKLNTLSSYANERLSNLSHNKIITFHDGFSYMANAFNLEIIYSVEEESGSEASASELKQLINLVKEHKLPAVFTERNGNSSAASIIANECKIKVYTLDMAMSGDSYFNAMYHNIDTLSEALK